MDGRDVDTSPLQRLAAYVREAALRAGYEIDSPRSGAMTRLANDAGMSITTLSRLLSGERMPDARYFAALAKALRVPLTELLVQSGIIPEENLSPEHLQSLRSRSLTPGDVADDWGITDPEGRELVRAMYERFRKDRQTPAEPDQTGSAEAQN
jgi:transcriptional regulator with XRE-family HTH domain